VGYLLRISGLYEIDFQASHLSGKEAERGWIQFNVYHRKADVMRHNRCTTGDTA